MGKILNIAFLSFGLGLVLPFFMADASQTNMSNYYPSPSGAYTKIQLVNSTGGPDENYPGCYCAQYPGNSNTGILSGACDIGESSIIYPHAGTIFADPTTGYLQNCKTDGTVASFPGSCFNRFGDAGKSPSCPANYQIVNSSQLFKTTTGNNTVAWVCCFSGPNSTVITKSGCFSTYSNVPTAPPSCSSFDPNAYDLGCDTISGSDITSIYKRNCCFNANTSANPHSLGTSSTQNASCGATICAYYNNVPNNANGYVEGEQGTELCAADQAAPQCGGTSSVGIQTGSPCKYDLGTSSPCPTSTPCPSGGSPQTCAAMSSAQDASGTTYYYCPGFT